MAEINSIIPAQAFEVVGQQLGAIITTELHNQSVLADDSELDATVFYERSVPVGISEVPAVNVMMAKGDYSNQDVTQADGKYLFYIDVYTKAAATGNDLDERGDYLAAVKLKRIMGLIRYILSSPEYRLLGYAPGYIKRCNVQKMYIVEKQPGGDADSVVFGRVEFTIEVPEVVGLITGRLVAEHVTQVIMAETEVGYRYVWSVKVPVEITTDGSSFSIPPAYTGMELAVIIDNTQPYNSSGFTQAGDVITMTNGASYIRGQQLKLIFRINNYATDITIATAGNTITLPASVSAENIAVIITGTQAYNRNSFTQADGVLTMTNGATYLAGEKITVMYGVWLISITATAGNTLTLPGGYAGFEAVAIVNDPQTNTSISQNGQVVTMTDETIFLAGQIVNIILR